MASLPTVESHGSSKPGYTTTEFWVTVLTIVGCFTLVMLDKASLDQVWPILAGLGGGYSLSRGIAKAGLAKIIGRG